MTPHPVTSGSFWAWAGGTDAVEFRRSLLFGESWGPCWTGIPERASRLRVEDAVALALMVDDVDKSYCAQLKVEMIEVGGEPRAIIRV